MPFPSIDTFTFTGWPDRLMPRQRRSRTVERADVDGSDVVWGAWTSEPQKIRTVADVADRPAAIALAASYRGIISQSVTVIDELGRTWSNVVVLDVDPSPSPTLTGARVSATWLLLPSAASDPA